jgi:hypothetical protein
MNQKIQYALNKDSGDVLKYFSSFDNLISNNSGVRDNRCITRDCYDSNYPFNVGTFTHVALTDSNVHISNIDKEFITQRVQLKLRGELFSTVELDHNYSSKFCYVFVGFKSGMDSIDSYYVNWNNLKSSCENIFAAYESFVTRAVKPKSEQEGRADMYTTYESARNFKKSMCGVYIPITDLVTNT